MRFPPSKKRRIAETGRNVGGARFGRGALYHLLKNRIYRGEAVHKGVSHPGEHDAIVDEGLWGEVQAKLAGNVGTRRQARIDNGALLMGLLFDDRGNRMSPSYTTRKSGRYRYYVSQALLQGRKDHSGAIKRIGAEQLEIIVVAALRQSVPAAAFTSNAAPKDTAVRSIVTKDVATRDSGPARDLVRATVDRVILHAREAEIVLLKAQADISETSATGTAMAKGQGTLRVPLPERRAPDRKEILIPNRRGAPAYHADRSLLLAVARGRTWVKAMLRGEYADTAAIASRCDLSEQYVRRSLRLAYLAPDIVEAITEGRQPRSLTLTNLLSPLPLAWAEQRRALRFEG